MCGQGEGVGVGLLRGSVAWVCCADTGALGAAEDDSALHDEADAGSGGDVGEGVSVDCDDVGVEARFELADLSIPTEELCAVEEVGAENVGARHAVLLHEDEFAGLGAVREGADVRADGEGDTGGELAFELGDVEGDLGARLCLAGLVGGVIGEVFRDGEGRHGVDGFGLHRGHGCVAEEVGVIDRFHSGLHGIAGSGLAGGVDGDAMAGTLAQASGFGDGCLQLVHGVLERSMELPCFERVFAGLVDFGKVRAFLSLRAHGDDDALGGVGVVGVGEDVLCGVVDVGVLVPAQDIDGHSAHAHAWARDHAGVYGVADGGVGRASAFGAHIAFGGEAGDEVGRGGAGGDEGALWNALLDGLKVFGARVEEEVHVRVDQSGHEGAVAGIDDLGSGGMGHVLGDLGDAIAGDEDFGGGNDACGGYIEHVRGAENDHLLRLGELGGGGEGGGEESGRDGGKESFHGSSSIP